MSHPQPTILCVDDDAIVRETLSRQLAAAGYPVVTAASVSEAIDVLGEVVPRIVISDWAMPGADGMDLCRYIRGREDLPFVYIIMLTAYSEKGRLLEAFDAGVDDFLAKPFDAQELEARLHAARRVLELEERLRRRMDAAQRLSRRLSSANVRLKEQASTDELTGLYNRREAMRRLNEFWNQAKRYDQDLSVAIADVDRFKAINDRYGHAVGDAVLKQVAQALREGVRECDVVFRIGGDEFLIIMPYTNLAAAQQAGARCRQATRRRPMGDITADISIGTATRTPQMQDPQELLQAADHSLYAAKALLPPRMTHPLIIPEASASSAPPIHADADARLFVPLAIHS